ncbi:MAG: hypothetical protein ACYYK0_03635 [Candidatus Eutrophobiaceae bacterium]
MDEDSNDVLWGEAGRDDLRGSAGGDTLHGGAGDDVLRGGDGNDTLRSETWKDVLIGGEDDVYLYGSAVASGTGRHGCWRGLPAKLAVRREDTHGWGGRAPREKGLAAVAAGEGRSSVLVKSFYVGSCTCRSGAGQAGGRVGSASLP